MGDPRILYREAVVPNMSFETDAPGTSGPPTGWLLSGTVGGSSTLETSDWAAAAFRLSIFDQSIQSLRFERDSGDGAFQVYVHTLLDRKGAKWVPAAGDKMVVAMGALGGDDAAGPNLNTASLKIELIEKDASDVTITTHSATITLGERRFVRVIAELTATATGGADHVRLQVSNGESDRVVYIDQVLVGIGVDFDGRGIKRVAPGGEQGFTKFDAGGASEVTRVGSPTNRQRLEFNKIGDAVDIDADVRAWLGQALKGEPFAFWADRDFWTNSRNHYRQAVLSDRGASLDYPLHPVAAYELMMEIETPVEVPE